MSVAIDLARPWALLLLPLGLLPLLRRRSDLLTFSYLGWLPVDRAGQVIGAIWRGAAALAIGLIVVGLGSPGRPEMDVAKSGRGAEIVVLIDRSRSMDMRMLPSDWRDVDPIILTQQAWNRGPQKSKTARDLLSRFVKERVNDRFDLMFFSGGPIPVVPFTQHGEVVQAGITAGGTGPGLSQTDVGRALLAASAEFDRRPYSGSRIILLVSDGGAQLDPPTKLSIAASLRRNHIALYWLYLRSINAATLDTQDPGSEVVPEIGLHRFFQSLGIPYHAYQADEPKDLAQAVAEVGRQQNLPLDYLERVPRSDYGKFAFALAGLCCLILLGLSSAQLRSWK